MAQSRRAAPGEPGLAGGLAACSLLACGRLRNPRAYSNVSFSVPIPMLRAIRSRRSKCCPVAESVLFPPAPGPEVGPVSLT